MSVSLTGADTIKISSGATVRSLVDLADADVAALTFPNELMGVKTGKNGNSIYAFNETGRQCELVIRLIRGSADDKFMANLLAQMKNSPTTFNLLAGEFIKKVGDGQGNVTSDTYITSGGVFTKEVPATSNADGNTDQSVAVYTLKFSNAPRVLT